METAKNQRIMKKHTLDPMESFWQKYRNRDAKSLYEQRIKANPNHFYFDFEQMWKANPDSSLCQNNSEF